MKQQPGGSNPRYHPNRLTLQWVEPTELADDKKPVLFDTNFLFITFQFKVDVIRECERLLGKDITYYITEATFHELAAIDYRRDRNRKYLPLVLSFLERYGFKVIRTGEETYVDDLIVDWARGMDFFVATSDKQLKFRLKGMRRTVIYLRQCKYLEMTY